MPSIVKGDPGADLNSAVSSLFVLPRSQAYAVVIRGIIVVVPRLNGCLKDKPSSSGMEV